MVQIYHAYIETITAAETRRQQTTAIYLALSGGLLAAIAAGADFNPIILVSCMLILGLIWWQQIQYFQDLASAKWQTCIEIEKKLPAQAFATENKTLKDIRRKKTAIAMKLSEIEILLPKVLFFGAGAYLLYRMVVAIGGQGTE